MGTPKSETKYAERYLQDPKQVENLVKYLNHMKKFYELEREIKAIFKQRTEAIHLLLQSSWKLDHEEFGSLVVRFILSVRRLTIKLLEKVGEWRRLRKKSSATFYVEVEEPPTKPIGLRSSNFIQLVQNHNQNLLRNKARKECVICHIKENRIEKLYGSLFVKFIQVYMADTVFFTPRQKLGNVNLLQTERLLFKKMILNIRSKMEDQKHSKLEHQC
jgi:hypothetical protein